VADDDAAGGQQFLHHAQPEREAELEADGMPDDLNPGKKIDSASCCTGKSGINRYSRDHHEAEVAGALARSRVRAAGAAHPAGSMLRVSRRLEILDRRACST